MIKKFDFRSAAAGLACGAANGLFGSGGGLIAVPMLENEGCDTKQAHATSIAVTLPLSAVSAFIYFRSGSLEPSRALMYLPGGMLGVIAGSALMKKISSSLLKKLFAAVMIYFGVRMLI